MVAVLETLKTPRIAPSPIQADFVFVEPSMLTEEEFEAWCAEDVKAEFVDGEVIVHSPVRIIHSELAIFLTMVMKLAAEHSDAGHVFGPEVQIRLRPGLRRVPDVMFIAKERAEIVLETRVEGAPDLAVEIVSPDSVERDWQIKYLEYQAAGIREYWVVDPGYQRVRAYLLSEEGVYQPLALEEGWLRSRILPGFAIRPEWLWQDPLPATLAAARELGLLE